MGLTEEEAYEILELPNNASYETVLKSYKRLSLLWFPDKHDFSPTALENFRKISLAVMKLSFPERNACLPLTQTDMFLVFHQIFFGGEKCSCDELSHVETKSETTNAKLLDGNHEKDKKQGLSAKVIPSHEEIIMKRKKRTEKRKAERKRKQRRLKLEKNLENQKKYDQAAALSSSAENHKEKKKSSKEVANSDVCTSYSNDSPCGYDDCLDDHSGSESDDIAKKYKQLPRDPSFFLEYDCYWGYRDACYFSVTESNCSDSDYSVVDPDEKDFFDDMCGKLKLESLKNAAVSKLADQNALDLIAEEERKKKQTERRKKQKKKRKEKKKVEKAESEETKNGKQNTSLKIESTEMSNNRKSSESEENIDLSSAFVVAVAKKKKINQQKVENLFQNSSEQINCSSQAEVAEEDVPCCASINLAIRGNEMALVGNYDAAVKLFTEAITLDSFNYRYFGNRSYCYERLGQYENAHKDAEEAIDLLPKWAKGHFRKGKALVGMKKYSEADMAFKEVLALDPECKDVRAEIFITRVLHIMEKGFSRERAEAAVRQSEDVESALNLLLSEDFSVIDMNEDVDVFVSDENGSTHGDFVHVKTKTVKTKCTTSVAPSATKTLQTAKIFVGHVPEDCRSKDLESLFQKYGKVKECDIVGGHAFVHMGTCEQAEQAIKALNNVNFKGSRLSVVHSTSKLHRQPGAPGRAVRNADPRNSTSKLHIVPNVPGRVQDNAVKSAARDECYFWRTTGCINPETCRFKHIKKNKGIDKKNSRLKIS